MITKRERGAKREAGRGEKENMKSRKREYER